MRVEVYYNLHKKCFSIRHKGIVISHANTVKLADVTFVVRKAGRERVLREKKKNVHAFVRGNLLPPDNVAKNLFSTARYNPYMRDSFFDASTYDPLHKADMVLLTLSGFPSNKTPTILYKETAYG
jgi:hypothetical protein